MGGVAYENTSNAWFPSQCAATENSPEERAMVSVVGVQVYVFKAAPTAGVTV